MSNNPSRSRGTFSAPGVCNFASLTPNEGWAERRETFGCSAEHPWDVHITRHARRLRGALRPMTQQYTSRNNITISRPDGRSVPIVSQTEIESMKTALSLMLALITTTAPSRCRAEAAGAGRLVPARLYRERLILHTVLHTVAGCFGRHHEAEQRHVSVGMDCVGLVLLNGRARP